MTPMIKAAEKLLVYEFLENRMGAEGASGSG
jgi:hypothetical protein